MALLASVLFEYVMGGLCLGFCKRRLDAPFDRGRAWIGLVQCGAAFLPLSSAIAMALGISSQLLPWMLPAWCGIIIVQYVLLHWWICLGCMIATKARRPAPWLFVLVGVPGAALLSFLAIWFLLALPVFIVGPM